MNPIAQLYHDAQVLFYRSLELTTYDPRLHNPYTIPFHTIDDPDFWANCLSYKLPNYEWDMLKDYGRLRNFDPIDDILDDED